MDDNTTDQIAECTANYHVGWKVLSSEHSRKRDRRGHEVNNKLGPPARILARDHTCKRPDVNAVFRGHGRAIGPCLRSVRPEVSVMVALLGVLPVEGILQSGVQDQSIDAGLCD